MTAGRLCGPCAAADAAWRDSPPVPGGIRIHTVATSARSVIDAQRARAEDHYARVRFQRDLITRLCAEGNHVPPTPTQETS